MKKTIIFIISFAFLLTLSFVIINNNNCKESTDLKDFTTGSYKDFNGGKSAEIFFEDFCEMNNTSKMRFYYYDYGRRISLHKYYSIFDVDIKYSYEEYLIIKEKLLEHTEKQNPENNKLNDYVVASIIDNKENYKNNTACICYNDETCVIRYLFVYKLKNTSDINIRTIIPWNFGDGWTLDKWTME